MPPTACLFDLAAELSRQHELSAAGYVSVVPVIVEDLEGALPVLRALASTTNGRLLYSGDAELQAPVPATRDVVRRAAVEAALTAALAGGTRHVVFTDLADNHVDASLVDPAPGPDPSQGEREILALARAACHEDLDSHDLVIVAFSEYAIDLSFRRAVWSLAVDQLSGLPHTRLKTLVFVAEATIDVSLHCQTGRGFRFAITGDRLLRRRERDDLTVAATQIARHTGVVVLFLGAGFSASSRLPLGNALRDSAIRRLLNIDPTVTLTSEELARRFHAWVSQRPGWLTASETAQSVDDYTRLLTLEQVIRAEKRLYPALPTLQELRVHHDAVVGTPGSAPRDLGILLGVGIGQIIVAEVNFDRLVELNSSVPVRVFFTDADFAEASDYITAYVAGDETDIPVLKLHGDIYDPDSCVVSAEQTEVGIGAHKLEALRRLIGDPQPLWIYVGASLRDRDLVPVLAGEDFARGTDERWVSPYLLDSLAQFGEARAPFWRDGPLPTIDDRLIAEVADAFFAAWRSASGL